MKKLIAILLALVTVFCLFACGNTETPNTTAAKTETTEGTKDTEGTTAPKEDAADKAMTYAEYVAAEMEAEVTILCYVQATQSWWDNKITVYGADKDGAYFIYELACTEEESKKMVPGALIKVKGTKGAWAGEVEVMDGTFEFVESEEKYIAEAVDLTDKMDSEELINYQNRLATFKGLTVKELSFKNEGGDDIYVTLTKGDKEYNFCVEMYLTAPDSDVYKAVSALKAGDKIDVTAYLYWYEGMNPHIVAVKAAA